MSQEKKRILELVQSGKLSAQEAIILLDALDNDTSTPNATSSSSSSASEPTAFVPETKKANDHEHSSNDSNKKTEKEGADSFYSQIENAGEQIFGFINSALNKIKTMDFQLNKSVEIPHVFQQSNADIERVDIDIANGPVKISLWDQPDVRIECLAKVYRYEDREDARNYFLDNAIFNAENKLVVFSTQSKWMRVETVVYLPRQSYKKISVRIFNGGLSAEELKGDTLIAKTTNGKIDLTEIDQQHISLETINGQIKINSSKADQLETETVNGTIDVSGKYRSAELHSLNGNIQYEVTDQSAYKVEAKAITGNIHVNVPAGRTVDGDIRSNLGSYKLELADLDILHEKKEMIQKQVTFKRKGSSEDALYLDCDTKTGTVHLSETANTGE